MKSKIFLFSFVFFFSFSFSEEKSQFFKSMQEEKLFYQRFSQAFQAVGEIYKRRVQQWNPHLSSQEVHDIVASVIFYTMYFNRNERVLIDPRLVLAIIKVESDFRLTAVSPSGAMGLGQLMPGTAASVGLYGAYVFHPRYNIYGTVRVLRSYFNRWSHLPYPQQYLFALASYNAGPNAVAKYGGVPPYRETIEYVRKVTNLYRQLAPELFPR